MRLLVKRHFKGPNYTIGRLYIDGTYFCDTMEDVCRIVNNDCSLKIFGKTAIPEGTYRVEMAFWSKFQKWYPMLLNVPCFTNILIHSGVTEADTDGCVLVGYNKQVGKLEGGIEVMEKLRSLLKDQRDVTITVE